jgi:hypothetical protein
MPSMSGGELEAALVINRIYGLHRLVAYSLPRRETGG